MKKKTQQVKEGLNLNMEKHYRNNNKLNLNVGKKRYRNNNKLNLNIEKNATETTIK